MTTEEEKQIRKVQKLLALADSSDGAEGRLAFEKAARLMAMLQMDEARCRGFKIENLGIGFDAYNLPSAEGCIKDLMSDIAKAFGGKALYRKILVGDKFIFKQALLFGAVADRTTIRLMFDYAYKTIERLKKDEARKTVMAPMTAISRRSRLRSFRVGIIWGMRMVLMEIIKQRENPGQEQAEAQTYALVLRDKSKQIDDLIKRYFDVVDKKTRTIFTDPTLFQRGVIAGKAVSFQKQAGPKFTPKN